MPGASNPELVTRNSAVAAVILGLMVMPHCLAADAPAHVPQISIDRDNITVDKSVRVKRGTYIIADKDKNGVLQVTADDVSIDFQGALLASRKQPQAADKSEFDGIGIAVNGHKNVVIKNAKVHGYRFNIRAEDCDRLRIEGCDASHSRAQRIGQNGQPIEIFLELRDINSWREYGAGIWLEKCLETTVTGCRAGGAQNGICLAFCRRCTIHDNDASFNSGWGIALWSSRRNVVSWNHADFSSRLGESDNAALAVVNESHGNLIVGNSLTYSGDGLFLTDGENQGVGTSNENVIAWNDGSWAAANAFEGTFSDRNVYYKNVASDSRYGFWLGYSSNSLVIENTIERNSVDGIAIGCGSSNRIEGNSIVDTGQVAVHVSADSDNEVPSRDIVVAGNVIRNARAAVGLEHSTDYYVGDNQLKSAPLPQGLVSTKKDRPMAALQEYEKSTASQRVAEILKTRPKNFKFFREQTQQQGLQLIQLEEFAPRDFRKFARRSR